MNNLNLRGILEKIGKEYENESKGKLKGNPFASFVRNDAKKVVSQLLEDPDIIKNPDIQFNYEVTASVGEGRWAAIPWIAIFDKYITTKAQYGYYVVYLFSPKEEKIYLSLSLGWTYFNKKFAKKEIKKNKIKQVVSYWQNKLGKSDDSVKFSPESLSMYQFYPDEKPYNPFGYSYGTIMNISYNVNKLPSNLKLKEDLKYALVTLEELKNNLKVLIGRNKKELSKEDIKKHFSQILDEKHPLKENNSGHPKYKYSDEDGGYSESKYSDEDDKRKKDLGDKGE
ncbi:MAG: MrcB family domain-containing protein, partial [Lactobacillus sp.]